MDCRSEEDKWRGEVEFLFFAAPREWARYATCSWSWRQTLGFFLVSPGKQEKKNSAVFYMVNGAANPITARCFAMPATELLALALRRG